MTDRFSVPDVCPEHQDPAREPGWMAYKNGCRCEQCKAANAAMKKKAQGRLMDRAREVDRLRQELEAARQRIRELEQCAS